MIYQIHYTLLLMFSLYMGLMAVKLSITQVTVMDEIKNLHFRICPYLGCC